MLETLLASGARPKRHKKGLLTSVLVHAGLIGGAVFMTARAVSPAPEKEDREEKIAYVAPKPAPEPLPETPKVRVSPRREPVAPKRAAAPPKAAPRPPAPRPAMPRPAAPAPAPAPITAAIPSTLPPVSAPVTPPGPTAAELAARAAEAAANELARSRAAAEAAESAAARGRVESESGGDVGRPSNATYDEAEVDVAVRPLGGAVVPKYPESQRSANSSGTVSVQFIVSADGRVESGSIKILSSPHNDFSEAVRRALLSTRYRPAEAGGKKVRQLVEQNFTFKLAR